MLNVLDPKWTSIQLPNLVEYIKSGKPVLVFDDPLPLMIDGSGGGALAPRQGILMSHRLATTIHFAVGPCRGVSASFEIGELVLNALIGHELRVSIHGCRLSTVLARRPPMLSLLSKLLHHVGRDDDLLAAPSGIRMWL